MKTFFGSIYHSLAASNKVHMIWCAAILLTMLILALMHHRWRDDAKKLPLWRLLCLLPLITVTIHFIIYVESFPVFLSSYIPMYIIAVFALIPIFFSKRKTGYRIAASLSGVLSVICGFYFCTSSPNYHSYTKKSYTDSFRAMIKTMDKEYVLKEWKNVDFSALEEKYMPMVEEAERLQDPAKFADAVMMFANELHDGHVAVSTDYNAEEYTSSIYQLHEYGLATVLLDSGEVIAVCTSEEVGRLGIEDGTVITKWNGKPVLQAAAEDVPELGLPVKANEDHISVMYLSAVGGETVGISFIDKNGAERTETLYDLGTIRTFP